MNLYIKTLFDKIYDSSTLLALAIESKQTCVLRKHLKMRVCCCFKGLFQL